MGWVCAAISSTPQHEQNQYGTRQLVFPMQHSKVDTIGFEIEFSEVLAAMQRNNTTERFGCLVVQCPRSLTYGRTLRNKWASARDSVLYTAVLGVFMSGFATSMFSGSPALKGQVLSTDY